MSTSGPLLPTETLRLRSLAGLAKATSVLLVLSCVSGVLSAWADWNTYHVADAYLAGEDVSRSDLEAADTMTLAIVIVLALTIIATAAVFLVWLWRARLNAEALRPDGHRLRRGWTIGGWFCPIVNFWYPFRIVDDIWQASRPRVDDPVVRPPAAGTDRMVRLWWGMWLGIWFTDVLSRLVSRGEVTLSTLQDLAFINTFGTLAQCLCAMYLIGVMRRIGEWQAIPRGA